MLEFILEYRGDAHNVFTWAVCLAALLWGGGPERAFALLWLLAVKVIHPSYHAIMELPFQVDRVDVFHASLDVSVAVVLTLWALNANRIYPLWIAAFQIIATSAHLVRELVDAVSPIVYAIMVIAPSYFQLAIFASGLIFHIRRKRRHGAYRDWREPVLLSPAQLISVFSPNIWRRPFK